MRVCNLDKVSGGLQGLSAKLHGSMYFFFSPEQTTTLSRLKSYTERNYSDIYSSCLLFFYPTECFWGNRRWCIISKYLSQINKKKNKLGLFGKKNKQPQMNLKGRRGFNNFIYRAN